MSQRSKFLNPAELFRTYWQILGDGRSLAHLQSSFPINPKTGRRVTRDAGYKAMWRWACRPENYQEAFQIFQRSMMGHGDLWTEDRFKAELKEKARWILTRRQYKSWYHEDIPMPVASND